MRTVPQPTPPKPVPSRKVDPADGHTVVNGMAMAEVIVSLVIAVLLGLLMIARSYPEAGWWQGSKSVFWLSFACLMLLIDGYLRYISDRKLDVNARMFYDTTGGMVFMIPVWVYGLLGAVLVYGLLMMQKPVPAANEQHPGGAPAGVVAPGKSPADAAPVAPPP